MLINLEILISNIHVAPSLFCAEYCKYYFITLRPLEQLIYVDTNVYLQTEMPLFPCISQPEPISPTLTVGVIYIARHRLKTCHPTAELGINQWL